MVFSIFVSKTIQFLLLYCFLTGILDLAHADPPYNICSNITNYAPNSPFQSNLNGLLNLLSSNASLSKLYNTSFGDDPYRVYGQFLCLNYITNDSCNDCISTAAQDIQKLCPDTNEAVVWEEVCQLRYSNKSFLRHLDVTGNIRLYNKMNYSNTEPFRSVVNATLANLTKQAAYNLSGSTTSMYYATGEAAIITDVDTLYALVQCSTDLSPNDCNTCLQVAITDILISYFYRGGRLLSRSCYLRYELYGFYKGETDHDQGESGQRKRRRIIIITVVLACLLVAIVGSCVFRLAVRNRTKRGDGKNEIVIQQSHLQGNHHNFQGRHKLKSSQDLPFFDLKTILAATDNFSDSNKIGQGGYGPVYKGVLSDGKEVAVKKLSSNSEQGSDEFTNEVLLIMKLQHKNLVRLLGFCIEQEGKILVYEYMPNSSLDAWLFAIDRFVKPQYAYPYVISKSHYIVLDPWKRAQLDWSRRLNIINGIARGILYLHEDSRLRIIHRDLKASNVLLDHELNPKISDFGMARIFGGSQGQANTVTIVGTYGYMAPEYAMEGLYSIKSDVFSFGVLLLEILTGSRNAGFHKSKLAPSLLVYAWQLWNEGKGLEVMDPLLTDSCCSDEFLRCIHIGLLCVQEDAMDRPTMSSVVVMLKTEAVTPTQPGRPAFSVGRFTDHNSANNSSVNGMTVSEIMPL